MLEVGYGIGIVVGLIGLLLLLSGYSKGRTSGGVLLTVGVGLIALMTYLK